MANGKLLARLVTGAFLIAPIAGSAAAPNEAGGGPIGTWINPRGTVKVTTGSCGDKLCGWVIWANPQAAADAREAGVDKLVGTELLRNYKPIGVGKWQGQVYVPDMGRTFYSTLSQIDHNQLKISGCILGGLICKSQIWQRS